MKKLLVILLAMSTLWVGSAGAGGGVERYQFIGYTINVATVNGNASYAHTLYVSLDNPCDGTYSGDGTRLSGATETLSNITVVNGVLSATSTYDENTYSWNPSFTLNADGTITFVGTGLGGVTGATGTWTMESTTYNHGDYVAETIGEYGATSAQSCIGMPKVSKGHS